MELMRKGRPVTPEYQDVKDWLEKTAEPGGKAYQFGHYETPEEANKAMRALGASLRTQNVQLKPGLRHTIRRSTGAGKKSGVDVVVYVVQEPTSVRRLPQGHR